MLHRCLSVLTIMISAIVIASPFVRCNAAAPATYPAPLASRIPADAVLYFGWAGPVSNWPGYKESNLHMVLAHTHIADFIQGNLSVLLRRYNQLPSARNTQLHAVEFKKAFAIGSLLLTHPFAIYFRPINSGIRNVLAAPQVVLLMDAGKYPDAIKAIFNKLPHRLYPSGPRIIVGKAGSIIYVGIHMTSDAMQALTKKGDTLATATDFCRSMRFMPDHPVAAEFADIANLRHYLNQLLNTASNNVTLNYTPNSKQQRILINGAKTILNSKSIRNDLSFVAADGFSSMQWVDAAFLAMRLPDVTKSPNAMDMLALVPEASPDVSVSDFDLGAFISNVKTYIEAASPQARHHIEQALTMVNGITGVDMEHDMIDALGPCWLTYQSPEMPMTNAMGVVVVNRLTHPNRLARALQTLTPMALLGVNAVLRKRGYTGQPAQLRILNSHGAAIYYIKAHGVMPAWCISNGYLYLSAYPRPIQLALGRKGGMTSILANHKFIAIQKLLGCTHDYTNASYIDEPRLLSGSYNVMTTKIAAYSLLLGLQFNPPLSSLIPRLSDLQKATTTSGSVTWTDRAGWHSRSISGYPGSGMFVP